MKTTLLVIDPQFDFCDPRGALFVPGADADMMRLAAFVRRQAFVFDAVHVTLDTHHFLDIAHPSFWRGAGGQSPAPFTTIAADDITAGKWRAADAENQARASEYVRELEKNGRYALTIWPPHCLIGSAGHSVQSELFDALTQWEASKNRSVNFIRKGENPLTEHYSAIQAEVPNANDPATQRNDTLIDALRDSETIYVTGEAGSHCVANTVRDLADAAPELIPCLVLLTDAVSPVAGFADFQHAFVQDLTARGMQLSTTGESFDAH